MTLIDEEKSYISKIFNHGVSHLIDDSIPNRLICIHNLHWCTENLLRKTTQDWSNIDYRDGFELIFQKFCNKEGISVPIAFKTAITRLNTIRNDMEHRNLYHDIQDISNLIPKVAEFISWIVRTRFNTTIDLYSVSSGDEENIISNFNDWKRIKIEQFDNADAKNIMFILLIPSTYSPNLIDMQLDGINEMLSSRLESGINIASYNPDHESAIEKYFRCFRHLFSNPAQVFSIPTYMQYHNERTGNELRVFPDGKIYISFKYSISPESTLGFNMEPLFSGGYTRYIIDRRHIAQYNLPMDSYSPLMLEHILKVVLYSFHPECIDSGVKLPTKYHRLFIILPHMRINGQPRYLDRTRIETHWIESNRVYCGDEDDLLYKKTLHYDNISEILSDFKNWTYSFFRNTSDTSFQ
ncbi:MAG: hypothetical protein ACTSR7_15535 [Promethearchaeota archaeon]